MEYWIIVDRRHAGPYSAEQLVEAGLNDDTLVWCEGLTAWTPAGQIEELSTMMRMRQSMENDSPETDTTVASEEPQKPQKPYTPQPTPQPAPQAAPQPEYREAVMAAEPCPPAYIAWSIIATLLCCTIVGIPAIIFSSMTKSAYYKGDIEKARKYSEWAQWCIILSITLSAVSWPFQMAFMGF